VERDSGSRERKGGMVLDVYVWEGQGMVWGCNPTWWLPTGIFFVGFCRNVREFQGIPCGVRVMPDENFVLSKRIQVVYSPMPEGYVYDRVQ
jgi:hypothetical protein